MPRSEALSDEKLASDNHSRRLNILVGVVEDGTGGIGPYAEYVAAAAALSGQSVTLVAASPELASDLRARMGALGVEVIDLGIPRFGPILQLWRRLWPGAVASYLGIAIRKRMSGLNRRFDVAHLNMPALAGAVRNYADRVCVAAWFYPHGLGARARNSWEVTGGGHSRASFPRRLVILAKSISMYRGDRRGYHASDLVIAPTELLAEQLRTVGIKCISCYPPVWSAPIDQPRLSPTRSRADHTVHLITSCADLSNPRKNVVDTLQAAALLAERGRSVKLELIGGQSDSLDWFVKQKPPRTLTIETTGLLARDDAHTRVKAADLFVTSALYEEWGYAVVEALMLGTPAVTYPVYPFSELLRDGLGVVAREASPKSLSRAIEVALSRKDPTEDIGAAARARFDAESIGRRLAKAWFAAES